MRQHLILVSIFAVVLSLGYWGFVALFEEEIEIPSLVVVELSGEGEVTHSDASAEALAVGMSIAETDQVRIGSEGSAVLGIGEGTRLVMEADSSIRVLGMDDDGVRVELQEGRVRARVQADNPALQVEYGDRKASTADGGFTMSASNSGEILVRAENGDVRLVGFGEQAALEPGSYVQADSTDGPIVSASEAEALLMHVRWPSEAVRREPSVTVSGRTGPHLWVEVSHGESRSRQRSDEHGDFAIPLNLDEGDNQIEVRVEDPIGREVIDVGELRLDSTSPRLEGIIIDHEAQVLE